MLSKAKDIYSYFIFSFSHRRFPGRGMGLFVHIQSRRWGRLMSWRCSGTRSGRPRSRRMYQWSWQPTRMIWTMPDKSPVRLAWNLHVSPMPATSRPGKNMKVCATNKGAKGYEVEDMDGDTDTHIFFFLFLRMLNKVQRQGSISMRWYTSWCVRLRDLISVRGMQTWWIITSTLFISTNTNSNSSSSSQIKGRCHWRWGMSRVRRLRVRSGWVWRISAAAVSSCKYWLVSRERERGMKKKVKW